MSTELCGIPLAHPIVNASGTFDALAASRAFGATLFDRFPFSAFVTKTVTDEPRGGNPPPRLWELRAGMINSIGLPNKGRERFLAEDLPALADLPVPLIVNVMGSTADEFARLVEAFAPRDEVAALELNVSCPNVKTGLDIGADPREAAALVARLRPLTPKPLIVKLTPNTASPAAVARAVAEAGADAVSLINTLRALALHPQTREPWLGGGTGGMSRPVGARRRARAGRGRPRDDRDRRSSAWAASSPGGTRATCSTRARPWWPSVPNRSAIRSPAPASRPSSPRRVSPGSPRRPLPDDGRGYRQLKVRNVREFLRDLRSHSTFPGAKTLQNRAKTLDRVSTFFDLNLRSRRILPESVERPRRLCRLAARAASREDPDQAFGGGP